MSADALAAISTTIVPLAVSLRFTVPSEHVTVRPEFLHWALEGVETAAETKVTPASSVPVRTVFVVEAGPLLLSDQL